MRLDEKSIYFRIAKVYTFSFKSIYFQDIKVYTF